MSQVPGTLQELNISFVTVPTYLLYLIQQATAYHNYYAKWVLMTYLHRYGTYKLLPYRTTKSQRINLKNLLYFLKLSTRMQITKKITILLIP